MMTTLEELLERKYGTLRGVQGKLAADIGVDRSSVSNWFRGRNLPHKDAINKMSKLFRVSEHDLWEMFNPTYKKEMFPKTEGLREVELVPLTQKNTIQLPILADVPAGSPDYSDRDVEMFVDIPRFMFSSKVDYVVRCIGDSLEPKIHRGDFCVIRIMMDPIDGKAMLVRTEDGACMKIIKKMPNGSIQLRSLNKAYKPFTPKKLEILGQIVGHWSRDDRDSF